MGASMTKRTSDPSYWVLTVLRITCPSVADIATNMTRTFVSIVLAVPTLVPAITACKADKPASAAPLDAEVPVLAGDAAHATSVAADARTPSPATVFDLFDSVFGEKDDAARRKDAYGLYYMGGAGGSTPLMIRCLFGPGGAELRVNKAVGDPGNPATWRPGRDTKRPLMARDTAELHHLAQVFVEQVRSGTYADSESDWMDGAEVATEVVVAGNSTRVVRSDPNDGTRLSPFEKKLLAVAAEIFDGGIPDVRTRLPKP